MRRRTAFSLGLFVCSALAFQEPAKHPVSGRKIAGVMGMNGADWLVRPEREAEEQPEKALDALKLKPGMVVADIGAGVGYMSLRLARRVGPSGKVYANDLQPAMLDRLRQNAAQAGIANIITVVGDAADPKLPPSTMDLVLLVDVYHEFSEPQQMLRKIRATLKPAGRLVLLEYRAEDPDVPIVAEHKMTTGQVRAELEAEGFVFQPAIETLPRQHLFIFTKAGATPNTKGVQSKDETNFFHR